MTEVCPNVALEPHLQPLTGERFSGTTAAARIQDGARLDVAADGYEKPARIYLLHAAPLECNSQSDATTTTSDRL